MQRNDEATETPSPAACPAYGVRDQDGQTFYLRIIEQVFNPKVYMSLAPDIQGYEPVECEYNVKIGIIFKYKRKVPQQISES